MRGRINTAIWCNFISHCLSVQGKDSTEHCVEMKFCTASYCPGIGDAFSLKPWMQRVCLGLDLILCKWSWSPSDYCYEGSNYPTPLFCLPVQSNRMCTGEANCWEKLLLVCMTDQERSKFISDSLRQTFLLPLPLGEEDYNALSLSTSLFNFVCPSVVSGLPYTLVRQHVKSLFADSSSADMHGNGGQVSVIWSSLPIVCLSIFLLWLFKIKMLPSSSALLDCMAAFHWLQWSNGEENLLFEFAVCSVP